jgi:hypothetical protein
MNTKRKRNEEREWGVGSLALGRGRAGVTTACLLPYYPFLTPNFVLISGYQWFCSDLFPN